MPLFNISLPQQQQGSSSGVSGLPQIGSVKQYNVISDEFNRATLNPTNAVAVYATTALSTGTATVSGGSLILTTAVALNDYVGTRLSEILIPRAALFVDNRSNINIDVIFHLSTTTLVQGYFGLTTNAALTALPTTARTLGLFFDTSATGTFILTSADGTTQSTTDSGLAIDTNTYRLNILWTGNSSAVLSLFSGTSLNTLVKSQTVTSAFAINAQSAFCLQFWLKDLNGAAAANTAIDEWRCSST